MIEKTSLSIAILLPTLAFSSVPLFGPKTVARQSGKSVAVVDSFLVCEQSSEYKLLVITQGQGSASHVTSARVTLNGEDVIGPSDFKNHTTVIEKPVHLNKRNKLESEIFGKPGEWMSLCIICVKACLDIRIVSPKHAHISEIPFVDVQGILSSSSFESSVDVNGTPAVVHKDRFAIGNVALREGENDIVATLQNSCGEKAIDTVNLTAIGYTNVMSYIYASPQSGIAPFRTTLKVLGLTEAGYDEVAWDFQSDSVIDTSGASLLELEHIFKSPGIFTVTVSLKSKDGKNISIHAVIPVISPEDLIKAAQKKWDDLSAYLQEGDTLSALSLFDTDVRDNYQAALRTKGAADVVRALAGPLELKEAYGSFATFSRRAMIKGRKSEAFIKFIRDANGILKIRFF